MTQQHITKTMDAIENKITEINTEIESLSDRIEAALRKDSNFFASDRHCELFRRRSDLRNLRDELHAAFMTISRHF